MADFLPIFEMHERHPGLTQWVAGSHCEAAYVCLDRNHESPHDFTIQVDGYDKRVAVRWPAVNERSRRAWNNRIDTVEAGAYAMAIAAMELLLDLVAVARAETSTGADYYLGEPGVDYEDFESLLRLEVTGTESGSLADVARALRVKLRQLEAGNSNLPGRAVALGYRAGTILSDVPGGIEAYA